MTKNFGVRGTLRLCLGSKGACTKASKRRAVIDRHTP
jgi:hypothetical protein